MTNIIKYLKNKILFIAFILLIIIEILSIMLIPKFTSKIINIGILNEGIDYSYPKVITRKDYNDLLNNLNDTDKNMINSSYNIISINNISKHEYLKYKKMYPIIDSMAVYEFNNKNKNKVETIFKENNNKIKDYIINKYNEVGYDYSVDKNNYIIKTLIFLFIISIISIISTILISQIGYYLNNCLNNYFKNYILTKKIKRKNYNKYNLSNIFENLLSINIIILLRTFITSFTMFILLINMLNKNLIVTYFLIISSIILIIIIISNFQKTKNIINKIFNKIKNNSIFILNNLTNLINPLITILVNLVLYLIIISNKETNFNYFLNFELITKIINITIILFISIININETAKTYKYIKKIFKKRKKLKKSKVCELWNGLKNKKVQ